MFERRNEPSKCPSCESKNVIYADEDEEQAFRELHGSKRDNESHPDASTG